MNQLCLKWRADGDLVQILQYWTRCDTYQITTLVKFCILKRKTQLRTRDSRRSTHAAAVEYLAGSYQDRSLTKVRMGALPVQSPGISLVLQYKVGALLYGPDLARIGRLDSTYATSYLFSGCDQPEDLHTYCLIVLSGYTCAIRTLGHMLQSWKDWIVYLLMGKLGLEHLRILLICKIRESFGLLTPRWGAFMSWIVQLGCRQATSTR